MNYLFSLNADHARVAWVQAAHSPWVPSPAPGVQRRLLERNGGEEARATSIVRYAAGSSFTPHEHPAGEEFLVLCGVFSDEHGDYPAMTYVRNPPGSRHQPFSAEGCTIFVKLRQMRSSPTHSRVLCPPGDWRWQVVANGAVAAELYQDECEQVQLLRLGVGAAVDLGHEQTMSEALVLEGHGLWHHDTTQQEAAQPWSWWRLPRRGRATLVAHTPMLLWTKHHAAS